MTKPRITFVTNVNGVIDHYPIDNAGKHMPGWLRRAPLETKEITKGGFYQRTIKSCPGVIEYVSEGYVIPAWTDIELTRDISEDGNENSGWSAAWEDQKVTYFGAEMMADAPSEPLSPYVVKLVAPWQIVTEPGYVTMYLPLHYEYEKRFTVLPGLMDTNLMHQTNILLHINGPGRMVIQAGEPLCQLVVFKQQEFDVQYLQNSETYDRLFGRGKAGIGQGGRFFPNAYRKLRNRERRT